ncbi:MAG: hypothetical protein M3135_01085, partial [Actinomycetota bacterium]|nr:hypothetical protein [Actinomycetota bacterium]
MEREPHEGPEFESPEDEGIPDIGRPHPAKRATGDPQEGIMVPRDQPRGSEDWGTTAAEQREEAPLDDRLREEVADREPGERRGAGRLVEEGTGLRDQEKDLVASDSEEATTGLSAEEDAV